jgi:hypothetical protein
LKIKTGRCGENTELIAGRLSKSFEFFVVAVVNNAKFKFSLYYIISHKDNIVGNHMIGALGFVGKLSHGGKVGGRLTASPSLEATVTVSVRAPCILFFLTQEAVIWLLHIIPSNRL